MVLYTVEICISICKSVYNMQSLYNPNMCFGNGNKYFEFEFELCESAAVASVGPNWSFGPAFFRFSFNDDLDSNVNLTYVQYFPLFT